MKSKSRVLVLHNIVSPYRMPLFEKLQEDFDVRVLFCKRKTSDRKWDDSLKSYTFSSRILPNFMLGPFFCNPTIPGAILKEKYDVCLIAECPEMMFSTFTTLLVAKLSGKPVVLWSETIDNQMRYYASVWQSKNPLLKFASWIGNTGLRLYRKTLYALVDQFMAYGPLARDFLISFGVDENKITTGTQIMPKEQLENPPKGRKSPFPGKKVVLSLGYLNPRKGVDDLIRAFKQIKDKDVVLAIAGSGPYEEELKKLAKDDARITFVGHVHKDDRAFYYGIADIFAFPTHHDCWGLVINEALRYGVPIVSSDKAGGKVLVEDGKNGFVFPSGSVDDLKKKLQLLIRNNTQRKQMATNAKQTKTAWSISHGVKPIRTALKAALGGKK